MKIAATAPEWPWTDLAQSLQPNGSNLDYVAEAPYSGMLGNHEYGIQKRTGTKTSISTACCSGRLLRAAPAEPEANITEWYNFNGTGGPYNGKAAGDPAGNSSCPTTAPTTRPVRGTGAGADAERLERRPVPRRPGVDYYNKVRATYPNAPIQLFDLDYGHNPRSATSPSTSRGGQAQHRPERMVRILRQGSGQRTGERARRRDRHHERLPAETTTSGHEYKAANWASLAPGEINLKAPPNRRSWPPAPRRKRRSPRAPCARRKRPVKTPRRPPTSSRRRPPEASRSPAPRP
jgi:hypothetical protein